MDQSDFLKEILIVIVLYKKSIQQSTAFKTIEAIPNTHKLFTSIFIYDNSPIPNEVTAPNIIYRHDPENNGVSKAYNEAFSIAVKLQKKWMLLLDQDSTLPPSSFQDYQAAVDTNPNLQLFAPIMKDGKGIVSPFHFRFGKGFRIKKIRSGIHSFRNFKIINSGMLVSTIAFSKSQGFDERFPLDLSDIVFLERLCNHYSEFFLIDSVSTHSLSDQDKDVKEVLNRFTIFCNAMWKYKNISKEKIWPIAIVFLRGMKLFFRHRNFSFFKIAMNK